MHHHMDTKMKDASYQLQSSSRAFRMAGCRLNDLPWNQGIHPYVHVTNTSLRLFSYELANAALEKKALFSFCSDLQKRRVKRRLASNGGNTGLMSVCQYFITSPGLSFSNHFFLFLFSFLSTVVLSGGKKKVANKDF